jgi:hypothetical protein
LKRLAPENYQGFLNMFLLFLNYLVMRQGLVKRAKNCSAEEST